MTEQNKDWSGNTSIYACNHRTKEDDVAENDLYCTHPESMQLFFEKCTERNFEIPVKVWEPCCVDSITEFYNGFEWKKICNYKKEDKVLCYNNDGIAHLEYPKNYIKHISSKKLYLWQSKSLDMCLTEDHRVVYKQRRTNLLKINTANEIVNAYNKDSNGFRGKIPTTFDLKNEGKELNEWFLRLAVACNADGTIRIEKNNKYKIGIKKERKLQRLLWLLKQANLGYVKHEYKDTTEILFNSPYGCKLFPKEWLFLDKKYREIIIEELHYWDGCFNSKHIRYSTSKKQDADLIQLIGASIGKHSTITIDNRSENENYIVCFSKTKDFTLAKRKINKNLKIIENYNDFVYCFTVSTGMLVLRRNNKIFITGNCGLGSISDELIKQGHDVLSTDLIDRGYGEGNIDFLKLTKEALRPEWKDYMKCIVTNPPYKYATECVEKALELLDDDGICIMFLKTTFLETKGRQALFKKHKLKYVWQYVNRQGCGKNTRIFKNGGAAAYAMFIWDKSYEGLPELDWIG